MKETKERREKKQKEKLNLVTQAFVVIFAYYKSFTTGVCLQVAFKVSINALNEEVKEGQAKNRNVAFLLFFHFLCFCVFC